MTEETFFAYLDKIRPYIVGAQIEKLAGVPRNCLLKHYNWRDGRGKYKLPRAHWDKVAAAVASLMPEKSIIHNNKTT